jgi:trk system potassium uptake protein TrkA
MKIIINGGGGVGSALAEILSQEMHDVTVVEQNPRRAAGVEEKADCQVIVGDGSCPSVLREAGAASGDIYLAVTDRDEVNLLSCLFARKAGCARSIARVRNRAYVEDPTGLAREMGIDQIINPDEEAAREIIRLLRIPGTTQVTPLVGGTVVVAGMLVRPGSTLVGRTLAEVTETHPELSFRVVAIRRKDETLIPGGGDEVCQWDELFVVAQPEVVARVGALVGQRGAEAPLGRVMILGANDLGRHVAERLQGDCRVKLIDVSGHEAGPASEQLSRTLVIEGSDHGMDLLEQEGLEQMDAFVAVADEEEMNLIGCLYARRLGVRRTIARVERHFYRPLTMAVGVDAAVSARQSTVGAILKYVRAGGTQAVAQIRGLEAEAIELAPSDRCKVLGKPLRAVRFPSGSLVGVVVRPDEVLVAHGDTVIHPGDHVVVFAVRSAIRKVERLFSV